MKPRGHDDDKKLIRFDWAMKRLLRDKASFVVLEGLLTSLLNTPIKIENLLESEGNKRDGEEKSNRVDIMALDSEGNHILIEVQNQTENEYFHRILFGTSRLIIDHMKQGWPYEKVPKVYSVNIVFFDLGDRSDYVYHGFTEFLGLHNRQPLELTDSMKKKFEVDKPGEILPEYYILLANDFNKWSKTPLDQWMYFLSTNTIPVDADAPGLKEAREMLDIDRLTKEEREAYYKHLDNMRSLTSAIESAYENGQYEGIELGIKQGIEEGKKQGIEEGKKQGIEEGKKQGIEEGKKQGIEEGKKQGIEEGGKNKQIEIALNLLQIGMPDEQISAVTGLPMEEIKRIGEGKVF